MKKNVTKSENFVKESKKKKTVKKILKNWQTSEKKWRKSHKKSQTSEKQFTN